MVRLEKYVSHLSISCVGGFKSCAGDLKTCILTVMEVTALLYYESNMVGTKNEKIKDKSVTLKYSPEHILSNKWQKVSIIQIRTIFSLMCNR